MELLDKMKSINVDCSTGIVSEFELTEDQIKSQLELDAKTEELAQQEAAAAETEAAAKTSARAKLAALGLTEEEVAALVK
jgi:outer membrane murein-binding lipoprotein Lpp